MNQPAPAPMGHNEAPDYAKMRTDELNRDYSQWPRIVAELKAEADAITAVEDKETMGKAAAIVKRFNDTTGKLKALHTLEKEPHLRAGNAVDQWFGGWIAACFKFRKTDKPGAGDRLQELIDGFNRRELAKERQRREQEENERREIARKAEAKRLEDEEKLRLANAAAARAKKPERVEELKAEAAKAATAVSESRANEHIAKVEHSDAKVAAAAPAADLARQRLDSGAMVTMKREPFVEITEKSKLDKDILWNYLKDDAILAALKLYAKVTQYKTPMPGAVIEMRETTVVR